MEVKVSLIIPVYNAERYIKNCVNSILRQSYQNFEIIIVNDGSTDGTLNVIEKIKNIDHRILVIDKKNEGVSIARNEGVEYATGSYLVFVDADDYLAPDYLNYMLQLVETTGAEFCLSRNCYTKKGESQIKQDSIQKLSPEDAVALLLSPYVIVGCWNKIFRADFIKQNKIRFSSDLFYGEGLYFIVNAAQRAKYIGVGNRKVYFYRRNNETSATTKFDIEKMRNGEKSLNIIKNSIKMESDKINSMWNLHMCLFSLGAITRMKSNHIDKVYKDDYVHWKEYIKTNIITVLKRKDISKYRKIMLLVGLAFPGLIAKIDVIRRKKISTISVE